MMSNEQGQMYLEIMTNTVAQAYVNVFVDGQIAMRRAMFGDQMPDPLPAMDVYHYRKAGLEQFNSWLESIKGSDV